MLDKIKTNPFFNVIWIALICVIHIVLFKSKVNMDYQIWQRILIAFIAVFCTFTIHELIHFVFFKMFGGSNVKIRIIKSPVGLPTLGTEAQVDFKKWQLIITYLAPFVFLTLLSDIAFLFCDKVELLFFVLSVCNCAGCFYDIVETLTVANKKD